MDETSSKRVYVYKIGSITRSFTFLLAGFFALGGLFNIVRVIVAVALDVEGALEALSWAVLSGSGLLLCAAFLVRRLRQDSLSSQTVVMSSNRVQLPMTKGDDGNDYLIWDDVLGTKIDNDYHDHGPALIVVTKTKPVAYKSMYFDKYKNFEDFCERFSEVLDANNSEKPKG